MHAVRTVTNWGWCPILITVLAIAGYTFEWPMEAMIPAIIIILVIGLVLGASYTKEKELERSSVRLRQLAGYCSRSLSDAG